MMSVDTDLDRVVPGTRGAKRRRVLTTPVLRLSRLNVCVVEKEGLEGAEQHGEQGEEDRSNEKWKMGASNGVHGDGLCRVGRMVIKCSEECSNVLCPVLESRWEEVMQAIKKEKTEKTLQTAASRATSRQMQRRPASRMSSAGFSGESAEAAEKGGSEDCKKEGTGAKRERGWEAKDVEEAGNSVEPARGSKRKGGGLLQRRANTRVRMQHGERKEEMEFEQPPEQPPEAIIDGKEEDAEGVYSYEGQVTSTLCPSDYCGLDSDEEERVAAGGRGGVESQFSLDVVSSFWSHPATVADLAMPWMSQAEHASAAAADDVPEKREAAEAAETQEERRRGTTPAAGSSGEHCAQDLERMPGQCAHGHKCVRQDMTTHSAATRQCAPSRATPSCRISDAGAIDADMARYARECTLDSAMVPPILLPMVWAAKKHVVCAELSCTSADRSHDVPEEQVPWFRSWSPRKEVQRVHGGVCSSGCVCSRALSSATWPGSQGDQARWTGSGGWKEGGERRCEWRGMWMVQENEQVVQALLMGQRLLRVLQADAGNTKEKIIVGHHNKNKRINPRTPNKKGKKYTHAPRKNYSSDINKGGIIIRRLCILRHRH